MVSSSAQLAAALSRNLSTAISHSFHNRNILVMDWSLFQPSRHVGGVPVIDDLVRSVELRGVAGDPQLDAVGDAARVRRRVWKNVDLPDELSCPEVPVRHRQILSFPKHAGESRENDAFFSRIMRNLTQVRLT